MSMRKGNASKKSGENTSGKNLENYAEVKDRIRIFYTKYPDGRITTEMLSWEEGIVIVRAKVYKTFEDQKHDCPVGVGHAYEEEDKGYVNKTSALENCETSAVGRALAMAGISIEKSVASKQEVLFAMERLEQMRQDGTLDMPAEVRRKYQSFVKIGVSKGLDPDFLYQVAKFARGSGEWTIEAMEDAIEVVESFEAGEITQEAVMKKLKEINRKQSA